MLRASDWDVKHRLARNIQEHIVLNGKNSRRDENHQCACRPCITSILDVERKMKDRRNGGLICYWK